MDIFPFQPNSNGTQAFQFQAFFDGSLCLVKITWNVAGQRYYANVYDETNTLVVCIPVVGSPPDYNISLTAGYFTTMLVFRQTMNQFEVI